MDTHTDANVKLLLSPRQSRGITYWIHFGDQLDFTDTAALCELMDIVISVDTSFAHLSGALGTPTCFLLPFMPDCRWLMDRVNSPWYPSVKLYRKPSASDWNSVFLKIGSDLTQFIAKSSP